MNFGTVVRFSHEIILINHAEPNQASYFVRSNGVFVITVIVITEFDCIIQLCQLLYFGAFASKAIGQKTSKILKATAGPKMFLKLTRVFESFV